MPTNWPRLTITLTPEVQEGVEQVKRELFWNDSKGDAIRYLMQLGIEKYLQEKKAQ